MNVELQQGNTARACKLKKWMESTSDTLARTSVTKSQILNAMHIPFSTGLLRVTEKEK